MRTINGIVSTLLVVSLPVKAQQPAQPSPPATETLQTTHPTAGEPASQTTQPTEPSSAQPNWHAQAPPTTMDQIVSRFIEREHNLMNMLQDRTPIVETYLDV